MLKLKKTIVNTNHELIGFIISGKEKEMGGMSDAVVEHGYPLKSIIQIKLFNNQIAVNGNTICERNNFKINSLPMVMYDGNIYKPMDNSVNIIHRFVKDNENVGFTIQFSDGTTSNFEYTSLVTLLKWYRPDNFNLRQSSKGNVYVCGKNGMSLGNIPCTVIGEEPENKPKRLKSAAKTPQSVTSGAVFKTFDILDVYDFINSCNGLVIKLPNEQYVAHSEGGVVSFDNFNTLGMGEVAKPVPLFNDSKLNVNANFKQVGMVNVEINGMKQNVVSYVHKTKTIFLNGENDIKKFGIAVPTAQANNLISKLGGSLALAPLTDENIISNLRQVIAAKELSFFTVDASKLDLISKSKRASSILPNIELVELCKKRFELKLVSKALGPNGGILKELKSVLTVDDMAEARDRKPFGIFSTMTKEGQIACQNAGIDIYTGAYTVPGEKKASTSSGSGSVSVNVEIEYKCDKYDDSKFTGGKVLEAVRNNDRTVVPDTVFNVVAGIDSIMDNREKYKKAKEVYDNIANSLAVINKKFWLHNCSMYLEGSKAKIHTHDAANWTPDMKTKVKKASVYECTDKTAYGLKVIFTGVVI